MVEDLNNESSGLEVIKSGTITSVDGFSAAGEHCGLKGSGKPDISIIYTPDDAVCSGVFTKNTFKAAPVVIGRERLKENSGIRALVINSGIANACTGKLGYANAVETIKLAARYLKIKKDKILNNYSNFK